MAIDSKEGRGVDRHLQALNWLAQQKVQSIAEYEIPEVFTDPSYGNYMSNIVSTSNIGDGVWDLFGFGAVHAGTILKFNLQ